MCFHRFYSVVLEWSHRGLSSLPPSSCLTWFFSSTFHLLYSGWWRLLLFNQVVSLTFHWRRFYDSLFPDPCSCLGLVFVSIFGVHIYFIQSSPHSFFCFTRFLSATLFPRSWIVSGLFLGFDLQLLRSHRPNCWSLYVGVVKRRWCSSKQNPRKKSASLTCVD